MGGREDEQFRHLIDHLAGHRVQPDDPLHLVAPELDARDGLLIGREYLESVAAYPELAPDQLHLVPLVLNVDEPLDGISHRVLDPPHQTQQLALILLGRAQPVDRRHRCHDDHIVSHQKASGGRMTEAVDLVVDRGVLLYIGVGLWDVGLGLVVVVVGDEVLDAVVGEELAELVGKLGSQGLVRSENERWLLNPLDGPGDGRRLA